MIIDLCIYYICLFYLNHDCIRNEQFQFNSISMTFSLQPTAVKWQLRCSCRQAWGEIRNFKLIFKFKYLIAQPKNMKK